MSETIIVAICAMLGTLGGAYLANRKSAALVEYRLKKLEEKVDLHNNVIERTYKLEEGVELLGQQLKDHETLYEEKIKVANHRIEDLEKGRRGAVYDG